MTKNSIDLDDNVIIDKLSQIFNKFKFISELIVYTSQIEKDNPSYLEKQLTLYNENIKLKINYNVDWGYKSTENSEFLKN